MTERPTLLQLFSPLLAKLTKLELYHDTTRYGEAPDDVNLVSNLTDDVFRYPPEETMQLIDKCLSFIEPLRAKGEDIVSSVSVDEYNDELGKYLPASDSKTEQTKDELFKAIVAELEIFEYELLHLRDVLNRIIEGKSKVQDTSPSLELPIATKLPDFQIQGKKINTLDIYQSALLFHYLKEAGIVLSYHPNSLSKFVSHLTGHSEQNLRTKSGFGVIDHIKSGQVGNHEKCKENPQHNLIRVKEELSKIVTAVTAEIDNQKSKTQKK